MINIKNKDLIIYSCYFDLEWIQDKKSFSSNASFQLSCPTFSYNVNLGFPPSSIIFSAIFKDSCGRTTLSSAPWKIQMGNFFA